MRKFTILAIILYLTSCSGDQSNNVFNKYDLANLVKLTSDTTEVIIKDFFPQVKKVDSVFSQNLKIIKSSSFDTIKVVRTENTKPINTIRVVSGGDKGVLLASDQMRHFDTKSENSVKIFTMSGKKRSFTFAIRGEKPEFIVLWQNTIIDPFNVTKPKQRAESADGSKTRITEVRVDVPHYASSIDRSYIRIIAFNQGSVSNDVLVPLRYGEVVTSAEALTRNDKHNQIIYSLLIDRFKDGDSSNTKRLNQPDVLPIVDYYGGDLEGIYQKIEEGFFSELGVTTIWLSPITQNPYDAWGLNRDPVTKFSGYHGYWPIYVTKIDDRFGNDATLERLLESAHERGMNVILDYVANHMHINSPTLKANPGWVTPDTTPDGRPNFELWDEFRLTTWFDRHIPSLDLERKEVYEPLTDSALFWLEKFDFDGFRHDATKHIPEVFWRRLTNKIKERFPGRVIYQIGETYGSPQLIDSYVRNGMLDAQFDFNVYDSMIWSLIEESGSFTNVWKTLENSLNTYGYHNLMGYITGNHDRPRFISLAGKSLIPGEDYKLAGWKRDIGVGESTGYNKLSLLHAFILTIPGVPTIYYGDEYGEPGGNDPDNRRWMRFEGYNQQEGEVLAGVKKLTHLRRSSMALIYGDIIPLKISEDIMCYARIYMGEIVIIALNKSGESRTIEVNLPALFSWDNMSSVSGKLVSIGKERAKIEIAPLSYTIISNAN